MAGQNSVGREPRQLHPLLAPLKTTLIAALLCAASVLSPCAQAQQSGAYTSQLTLLRAQAEGQDRPVDLDQARRLLYALSCLGLVTLSRGRDAAPVAAPVPDESPSDVAGELRFVFDDKNSHPFGLPQEDALFKDIIN